MDILRKPCGLSIDEDRKIVFVHIPRTGGTSIVSIMKTINPKIEDLGVRPYSIFKKEGYNSFTIVRHPYERFISAYNVITKEDQGSDCPCDLCFNRRRLVNFFRNNDINECIKFLDDNPSYMLGKQTPGCFTAQTYFISSVNHINVDNVIYYEDSKSKKKFIKKYYGDIDLPFINKIDSDKQKIYDSISDESFNTLNMFYWLDFKLLNYERR